MRKLSLMVVAILAVGALGTMTSASGPDRVVAGSLIGTNVMGADPSSQYFFDESGSMTLEGVLPGQKLAGSYTLSYNRLTGPGGDYADGVFTFSARGGTVTGPIFSTNYTSCGWIPNGLCMDVVIKPLTFSGRGPLGRFDGGSLELQREIVQGTTNVRTVTGTVSGKFCGVGQFC